MFGEQPGYVESAFVVLGGRSLAASVLTASRGITEAVVRPPRARHALARASAPNDAGPGHLDEVCPGRRSDEAGCVSC